MNNSHFDSLRRQFPVCAERIYLQSAFRGLLPTRSIIRLQDLLQDHALRGAEARDEWFETYRIAGQSLAAWLGTKFEQLVFVPNTAWAMSLIANGIEWESGDEILLPAMEFPSNVYPWMQLERDGVGVRVVPADEDGRVSAKALLESIRPNTRMISVSHVNFTTGYRMDIRALAKGCRERDVLCVVDAAQSVGWAAIDFDELGVDALTGVGRKFFCALDGLGFLLLRPELADRMRVSAPGPFSVKHERDYMHHRLDLKRGAHKFQNGAIATPQAYALEESVQMLQECGRSRVESRCRELASHLRSTLRSEGVSFAGERWSDEEQSPIVQAHVRTGDALQAALKAERISVSVRPGGVRIGLHAFNIESELNRLVSVLARFKLANESGNP